MARTRTRLTNSRTKIPWTPSSTRPPRTRPDVGPEARGRARRPTPATHDHDARAAPATTLRIDFPGARACRHSSESRGLRAPPGAPVAVRFTSAAPSGGGYTHSAPGRSLTSQPSVGQHVRVPGTDVGAVQSPQSRSTSAAIRAGDAPGPSRSAAIDHSDSPARTIRARPGGDGRRRGSSASTHVRRSLRDRTGGNAAHRAHGRPRLATDRRRTHPARACRRGGARSRRGHRARGDRRHRDRGNRGDRRRRYRRRRCRGDGRRGRRQARRRYLRLGLRLRLLRRGRPLILVVRDLARSTSCAPGAVVSPVGGAASRPSS